MMKMLVAPSKHKGPLRVFPLKGPTIPPYPNLRVEAVPFGPYLATEILVGKPFPTPISLSLSRGKGVTVTVLTRGEKWHSLQTRGWSWCRAR